MIKRIISAFSSSVTAPKLSVANPKKLQKSIRLAKATPWLHKDVRVMRRGQQTLKQEELDELAERSVRSTLGDSSQDSLQNFCMKFLSLQGQEAFEKFIVSHQSALSTLDSIESYKNYMKSCHKAFKKDNHLLYLFSFCDLRRLTTEHIPNFIKEETFDSEHRINRRWQYYKDQIPEAVPLFAEYEIRCDKKTLPVSFATTIVPEYIQNQSDLPNIEGLTSDRGFNTDLQRIWSNPRSLENFMKNCENFTEKKPVFDRIMIFNQDTKTPRNSSNWVFVQVDMGKDDLLTTDVVKATFEQAGLDGIADIKLFHNEPIEDAGKSEIDGMLQEVHLSMEGFDRNKIAEFSESIKKSGMKYPGQSDEKLTGGLSTQSSGLDKDTNRIKDIVKITSSVPTYNRGYGLVQFESYSNKLKAMNSHFRLFGMEMEKALLVIENADFKRTLRVGNLPWNLDPTDFVQWLNTALQRTGLNSIAFSVPPEFQFYISDASYVFLSLNSFGEALAVFELLNRCKYRTRKIYTDFRRGCARYVSGQIQENYYSASQKEREKQHIDRRSRKKQMTEGKLIN